MIQSRDEIIEVEQVRNLHVWLNKPEASLMEEIVAGQATRHELKAMADMRESLKGYAVKVSAAEESIRQAHRYNTFLEVLAELRADPQPVKLQVSHEQRN